MRGLQSVPLSIEDWASFLAAIGPRGRAWKDPGSWMWSWWRGLSPELARVHARILALVTDLNPTTMTEPWIALWETILQLPEADLPVPSTVAARRAAVIARLNKTAWGQSRPFYVALAALCGATVVIDLPDGFTSTFRVTATDGSWTVAHYGASVYGDPYQTFTTIGEHVRALFMRRKRLHARILWDSP